MRGHEESLRGYESWPAFEAAKVQRKGSFVFELSTPTLLHNILHKGVLVWFGCRRVVGFFVPTKRFFFVFEQPKVTPIYQHFVNIEG